MFDWNSLRDFIVPKSIYDALAGGAFVVTVVVTVVFHLKRSSERFRTWLQKWRYRRRKQTIIDDAKIWISILSQSRLIVSFPNGALVFIEKLRLQRRYWAIVIMLWCINLSVIFLSPLPVMFILFALMVLHSRIIRREEQVLDSLTGLLPTVSTLILSLSWLSDDSETTGSMRAEANKLHEALSHQLFELQKTLNISVGI